jgi:hypothetical protein
VRMGANNRMEARTLILVHFMIHPKE